MEQPRVPRQRGISASTVFTLVIVALVLNSALAVFNVRRVMTTEGWVAHTHEVLESLESLLSSLKDAETGQRGYLLTSAPAYLEPYDAAVASVHERIDHLAALTRDTPQQQEQVEAVRQLVDDKLAELKRTIEARRQAQSPAQGTEAARAVVMTGEGKRIMDEIRRKVAALAATEHQLVDERRRESRAALGTGIVSSLLGFAISLGLVLATAGSNRRRLEEQRRAADALASEASHLQTTLTSIGDAVIVTDGEGRITLLNGVAKSLVGWGQDAEGRPLEEVFHIVNEQTRQPVESPVTKVLRVGTVVGLANHTVLLSRDGRESAIDDSAAPIRDAQGRTIGVVLVFRDVRERRKAEQELLSAKQGLEALLDNSPLAVVEWSSADYRIERWSDEATKTFGWTAGEAVGKRIDELEWIYPEDRPLVEGVMADMLSGKRPRNVSKNRNLRKDGSIIECEWYNSTLRDPTGKFSVLSLVLDVTERKRAEEALRKSERLLMDVLDGSPMPVFLKDLDGRFLTVNKRLEGLLGLTREQLKGKTDYDILSKDNAENYREHDRRVIESKQPVTVEETATLVDGRHVFLNSKFPLVDAAGRVYGIGSISHDITDRKRAEMALRDQAAALEAARQLSENDKRRLEAALESRAKVGRLYEVLSRVNEAIVRCRAEQELHEQVCSILVELGGYPLAWIGQVRGERVVPTVAYGPAADYAREIAVTVDGELGQGPTGTSIREGHPVVNQDFLADVAMSPWRERAVGHGFRSSSALPLRRSGAVVGALTLYAREPGAFDAEHTSLLDALVADLSYAQDAIEDERLRALAEESLARSEAQLREADERKSQFLAMLSHELRNPLTPIKNSLHILNRVAPSSEQALRAKAVIERQVDQLSRLVDDLLDVTRLTRGKFRLERARLDLVDAVRRTAEDHKPLLTSAGIDFEVEITAQPLWIHGDAARLVQVIGNLLTNAAKFTPKGGKVTLSLGDTTTGFAAIRVQDTGVGIAKELLPHLFEPFMQAESTLDRSKGGLGLGLALVKGVVEMHGGTVEPRSEGAGCGAEFVVRLPIETGPRPSVTDGEAAKAPEPSRRVLVIEDNVDAAMSLRDVLALRGHEVEVAYDGCDGIAKARAFRPEVVICDIGLPKVDGYEVAKTLRADANLRPVRLVALSGYAQPEDLQRSFAAGFDAHLAKPASAEAIQSVVSESPESLGP